MTQQSALDDIIWHAKYCVEYFATVDEAVAGFKFVSPTAFSQALQDPRYLDYCKEQDKKEEGLTRIEWIDGETDFQTGHITIRRGW